VSPAAVRMHPAAWQTQSLLLGYPDDQLPAHLDLARRVVPTLPDTVAAPMRRFLEHATRTTPGEMAEHYVATFDRQVGLFAALHLRKIKRYRPLAAGGCFS